MFAATSTIQSTLTTETKEILLQTESSQKITPLLFHHVRKCQWDKTIKRCRTHPREILFRNKGGNTALHYACYRRPPSEVISALLAISTQLALTRNHMGSTPLHIACLYHASDKVIESLLDAEAKLCSSSSPTDHPMGGATVFKNLEGATPLHNACWKRASEKVIRLLLRRNPIVARYKEMHGFTPLHVAMWSSCSLKTIQLLLDVYPDAALVSGSEETETPLHLAVKYYFPKGDDVVTPSVISVLQLLLRGMGLGATTMVNRHHATPLHVAISTTSRYTSSLTTTDISTLLKLLIEANPSMCHIQDCTGATPLHLACCYETVPNDILKLLVYAHPKAKVIQDKAGCTPLHCLLATRACNTFFSSDNILDLILLLSSQQTLLLRDEEGATPLLRACTTIGMSPKVLHYLYHEYNQAIPITDVRGRTPLHALLMRRGYRGDALHEDLLLTIITENQYDVVSKVDKISNTALHYAIQNNASFPVLHALIKSYASATTLKNDNGDSPISLFWKEYTSPFFYNQYNDNSSHLTSLLPHDIIKEWDNIIPSTFWPKAKLLLLCNDDQEHDEKRKTKKILHVACSLPTPPAIIQLFLHVHPNQVREKDEYGMLPLHYAAMAEAFQFPPKMSETMDDSDDDSTHHMNRDNDHFLMTRSSDDEQTYPSIQFNTFHYLPESNTHVSTIHTTALKKQTNPRGIYTSIMDVLLNAYPRSSSIPTKDLRLPLHIACESGNKPWDAGICNIFQCYPKALSIRDGRTGLYPFMMAAVAAMTSVGGQEDCRHVNIIFELLIRDPSLVCHA